MQCKEGLRLAHRDTGYCSVVWTDPGWANLYYLNFDVHLHFANHAMFIFLQQTTLII